MAIYRLGEHLPQLDPTTWVADSASVIGQVRVGAETGIWYGAVVRGDNDLITIGERTSVQECAVLHTDAGIRMTIGRQVTVGHQAMLHGCTIGDGSLIGIGSVILNGASVGKHCLVGANSLITEGKSFPDGSLIMGSPAKVVRALTPEQIERLIWSAEHYVAQTARHRQVERIA